MSRGLGKIERSILALFEKHPDEPMWSTLIMLACLRVDKITHSQHVSFCRALQKLVRNGQLVDLGRKGHRYGRRWYALPATAEGLDQPNAHGLLPRDQIPLSIRAFAEEIGVSTSTMGRAVAQIKSRGA